MEVEVALVLCSKNFRQSYTQEAYQSKIQFSNSCRSRSRDNLLYTVYLLKLTRNPTCETVVCNIPIGNQVMRYGTEHANKAPLNCTVDYSQSIKGEISQDIDITSKLIVLQISEKKRNGLMHKILTRHVQEMKINTRILSYNFFRLDNPVKLCGRSPVRELKERSLHHIAQDNGENQNRRKMNKK